MYGGVHVLKKRIERRCGMKLDKVLLGTRHDSGGAATNIVRFVVVRLGVLATSTVATSTAGADPGFCIGEFFYNKREQSACEIF